MKVRVVLNTGATEVVSSEGQISLDVDGGVLTLYGSGAKWLATFGPGCWLSAVGVKEETER